VDDVGQHVDRDFRPDRENCLADPFLRVGADRRRSEQRPALPIRDEDQPP